MPKVAFGPAEEDSASLNPPVDLFGSAGFFFRSGDAGGAKVFWTVPSEGQVHITIVIPPSNEGQGMPGDDTES